MRGRHGVHFYLNFATALTSIALLVLTLGWRNWIEIAFGIDPDRNSGVTEAVALIVCAAIAWASLLGAGRDWRRTQANLRGRRWTGDAE
jgi:MFS superfamily sulfate permease-like transporter